MELICEFFQNNSNLIDIDLSKKKSNSNSFLKLLNKIYQNKKLRYVNLSNNNLMNFEY